MVIVTLVLCITFEVSDAVRLRDLSSLCGQVRPWKERLLMDKFQVVKYEVWLLSTSFFREKHDGDIRF